MRRSAIKALIIGLLLSGLFAGCKDMDKNRKSAKQAPGADGSIHLTAEQVLLAGLKTTQVESQEIAPTISAVGQVRSRQGGEAQIFAPFPGRIVADPSKLPRLGAFVKKGEVLAEVEQVLNAVDAVQFSVSAAQLQAALDQSEHEVNLSRVEMERAQSLYKAGIIALKQKQVADFDYQQAQTRLESARQAKARYEAMQGKAGGARRVALHAPISGVVVAADITAGQQVDVTKNLFTIADLSTVWVEAQVFENDLAAIRQARQASIFTRADPEESFTGHLVTIGDIVDPTNRTVTVMFEAANPQHKLKLGMFAEARIPTGKKAAALLVPASSILEEEGRKCVFVETGSGVYQRRDVVVGSREGGSVVITSGLKAGEKVVSAGTAVLRSEASKSQIRSGEEKD